MNCTKHQLIKLVKKLETGRTLLAELMAQLKQAKIIP